jgi:enoyl-CoA hydratase/carnithine racemase
VSETATTLRPSYFDAYPNLALERSTSGVLTARFHTDGGPVVFTGDLHHQFPKALAEIADDRDNKVLVLTGTGDRFMTDIDGASLGEIFKPSAWDPIVWEGRKVVERLVDLPMPLIAAINGPATVHSEYVLLADITIAADTATFRDDPHLGFGIVPGDGIHVIWEELVGVNRARYFALTQATVDAPTALTLGMVNEVVRADQVLGRALAIAEQLATKPQLLLRYTPLALRQRLARRMNDGTTLGLALEGLTAADMAYRS